MSMWKGATPLIAFEESKTRINLMRAFAGESQARNRYTFAASVCRQQKLHVVEAVFRFTADQDCLLYTSPSPRDRG